LPVVCLGGQSASGRVQATYGTLENIVALERAGIRAYTRLRQQEKVNSEALLLASGQNLKRLLSWRGWGRRGWPGGAAGVMMPRMVNVLF
jgi:hypothetical protein